MICDLCGEREATVHLTEIIDDETRELHLCETCAQEKGAKAVEHFGLAGLLAGLADFGAKAEEGAPKKRVCSQCGISYEDFRKTGRFGCAGCYEAFHNVLAPLLKRIHGSTRHLGKVPAGSAAPKAGETAEDLTHLKERLRQAISSEDFEEATRLRDRIRALEGKSKKKAKSE